MASSSTTTFSHLLDRTRVPDPSLQRQAVAAFFGHLRGLPPPLPPASLDAISGLLVSPSPAVAGQSVLSICRLSASSPSLLPPHLALPHLLTALSSDRPTCPDLLIKAIAFLARATHLPIHPHHPFVQALASGAEGVHAELLRQAARLAVDGVEGLVRFLRPFLMFAVVRKTELGFGRDLVHALGAAAVAAPPGVGVGVLKLLGESLRHFACGNEEEVRLWLSCAECLVDAYVVLLRKLAHAEMPTYDAQACVVELMGTLLLLSSVHRKLLGVSSIVLELSKHLLAVQKDLGLHYLPEFSVVFTSLSFGLHRLEFEHEQLAGLKLLAFLIEWKYENALNTNDTACHLSEELLCVLPVINLVISPSKAVKAVASHVLSRFSRLLLDLPASPSTEQQYDSMVPHISTPTSILPKLLHHLWSQPQSSSSSFFFMKYTISNGVSEFDGNCLEAKCWTYQLREYLSVIGREKLTLDGSPSENKPSVAISLLVSSVASILVMHAKLGTSAAQSLATLGATDPKLGMPLLLVILFYSKIFYSNEESSMQTLLSLLESLPSLAFHSFMLPLALQTMSSMLQKEAKPVLYAIAVRLLCKIWMVTDWAFPNLQGILDPETFSNFISNREISTSIAASIRDVCKQNPDRGVDLILSVSSCIESHDSLVRALGLEGLSYLCEADVVDFYTAWKVISKDLLDYSIDPTVAHGLCTLLRWGAMDAEAYSEVSKKMIEILWGIAASKKHSSESSWVKARATAFHSLSHYKVSVIQDAIPDFQRRNYECFINEDNPEVLKAMENLQAEIIKFEHMNRRRVIKDKRTTVHKFEKLLDVFPQAVFSKEKSASHELPGAALLMLNFTPKDILREGTSKDLPRVHAAYEQALAEVAESLYISRNIMVALLALQSWKSFISRWMRAAVALVDVKESSKLDKVSKAANDIFKILCKFAPESIPRVAVNIALAIGALCLVVPPTAHLVISSASDFLLKRLFQYEHEHEQWSAAIALGLIFNCFHPTDKKRKFEVISGLLEVISKTESYLVKGACGLGLGYAGQGLLTRVDSAADSDLEATAQLNERALVKDILHTLSTLLVQLCPSTSDSFEKLKSFQLDNCGGVSTLEVNGEKYNSLDDDPWAVAGLVLGLGNSVVALYRLGAYEAVIEIKNMLISWIPDIDSGSMLVENINTIPLCMGSCLALPAVIAFCQRVELLNDDLDVVFNRHTSLASELLNLKKSGALFQNLLMAICIGAGSLLSCVLNDGLHSMRFSDVKHLLDTLKHIYTHPYPPLVHLGGMFGAVNAFGGGAGDLTHMCWQSMNLQINHEKDTSLIRGPILASPVGETLSTSMIQEIFLLAKDARDKQIQSSAAWAISFLRNRWLSKNFDDEDGSQNSSNDLNPSSQSFSDESLVWNLSLWLRDLNFDEPGDVTESSTIATVLKCLSKAPRLPAIDWGIIVRRCMKHEAQISLKSTIEQDPKMLREECLYFSLAHASQISPLLQFLDDLTDLPRFRRLEINLQSILLQHLSHLVKIFSGSRLEKLYEDLTEYFCSSVSPYLDYTPEQRSILRMSFWKGIHKCLVEVVSEESDGLSHVKECMECLLRLLNVHDGVQPEFIEEWSAAIECLTLAKQSWLVDMLQVHSTESISGRHHFDVAKKIVVKARLCRKGCGSAQELGKIKTTILSSKTEGVWWNVLVEVAASMYSAEKSIKREWLLDALEIGCVADYPSTALRFVGLLSGSCCIYMPLLIANPTNVLSDLPVTLPALLSSSIWDAVRSSAVDKLWSLTARIYTWAEQLAHGEGFASHDQIHESEAGMAVFLARVLHSTCIALKDHLPFDKQLKLSNLEAF